jgi:hypothetical protein
MKIIKLNTKLTIEEKETLLNYDPVDKKWMMDSTIQKHFNKALRQGWTPLVQYEYEDGTVAGYQLEAPDRAITIRNVDKKQMSAKQLGNLVRDDDEL